MANKLSIGPIIYALRKAKGSTQEELANAVKVSAQAVSKWENGGAPDTELIPAIADYFDVPIDKLFGRTGSPNISEAVNQYALNMGSHQSKEMFEKAFSIYHALHFDEPDPMFEANDHVASHKWNKEGYSLITSNGYGNLVTRKFWESIDLETASFARDLFALLSKPGMLEVLFALLRRKHDGPANFKMIKTALANTDYADEQIEACLAQFVMREIITAEDSPYGEIGKVYGFYPEHSPGHWYLGLCAVICAVQALKMSTAGRNFYGLGEWPISL